MIATNLNTLDLIEVATPADPSLGCRVAFPIYAATGAAASAVGYFEIEPGKRPGRHTHSAEEVLLVLQGEAEAEIDGERARLSAGGLALIPAMAPHEIRNVGEETLRVVGFFAGAALVHHFFEPLLPAPRSPSSCTGRTEKRCSPPRLSPPRCRRSSRASSGAGSRRSGAARARRVGPAAPVRPHGIGRACPT